MIVITFISIFISCNKDDWRWFMWSGAWVSIIGVILSVRPIFRKGIRGWFNSFKNIDNGHIIPTPEEIEEDRQTCLDAMAFIIGLFMTILGILISTFGGLLDRVLK